MPLARIVTAAALLCAAAPSYTQSHAQSATAPKPAAAAALIAGAADKIGGLDALRAVRTLRLEYTTTWFRHNFAPTPSGGETPSSVERNVDQRDYERPTWRQVRGFSATQNMVNIITDTVAQSSFNGNTRALHPAYLDERAELFLMAPERLLPRLHDAATAGKARIIPDTTVGGVRVRGVRAELDGRVVTAWINHNGWLTAMRIRAGQPLDFGIGAWGVMDVDVTYARWAATQGVGFPGYIGIARVGRPYKELFINAVVPNAPLAADSVVVPDSIRRSFAAIGGKAMSDVPVPTVVADSFGLAALPPQAGALGAVRLDGCWLVLGAGADQGSMGRLAAALGLEAGPARGGADGRLAVVIPNASAGSAGGVAWATSRGYKAFVPPGARNLVRALHKQQGAAEKGIVAVNDGAWHKIAGDSVWMEPLDVPDQPAAMLIWVPRLKWAYLGPGTGLVERAAWARLDERGFKPTRVGTARGVSLAVEAARPK